MHFLIIKILGLLITFPICAEGRAPSAIRPEGEEWSVMAEKARPQNYKPYELSAADSAKPLSKVNFYQVPSWNSELVIQKNFEYLRDLRFLQDAQGVLRRSTWLYPDDGCYARAALANKNLEAQKIQTPLKVFAFGNLLATTPNSLWGQVSWWYHVAPLISDGKSLYVLDPSLSPTAPLLLMEWLKAMGNPQEMRVSICASDTYEPYSPCKKAVADYTTAESEQYDFLDLERERLEDLGRDAQKELGDFPPWVYTKKP